MTHNSATLYFFGVRAHSLGSPRIFGDLGSQVLVRGVITLTTRSVSSHNVRNELRWSPVGDHRSRTGGWSPSSAEGFGEGPPGVGKRVGLGLGSGHCGV
jgi:hypothetical protein